MRTSRACLRSLPSLAIPCQTYFALRRPSSYEAWTNRQDILEHLPTGGYAAVYPGIGSKPDGVGVFTNPRSFWTNGGKGMAEYTNRNFYSIGTLGQSPPVSSGSIDVDASTLCATANPPCGVVPVAGEVVTFFPTSIDDQFRSDAGPSQHPYAKAASIFDPEFEKQTSQRLFSVNRFTFAANHQILIPRAVAYSAGFINYFFRGKFDIAPGIEGAYALVDTSDAACGVPCVFRRFKLRLKNLTPGDEFGDGSVTLVVKHFQNNCFRNDLSGEDGGPNFYGNTCRTQTEGVAVSNPISVASGAINRDTWSNPLTFTFPEGSAAPPLNASDVLLQVVFKGVLGSEADAVAVTTKDISEPNFVAVGNITDYAFHIDGDRRYHPIPFGLTFLPVTLNKVAFGLVDPAVGPALGTLDNVLQREHAQLSFLTDRGKPRFWMRVTASEDYPAEDDLAFDLDDFSLDESVSPPEYGRTCPVTLERGSYRQFFRYYAQVVHYATGLRLATIGRPGHAETARLSAKYASNCYQAPPPGTGGQYDLSYLTPLFTPGNARQWVINF